MVSKSLVVLLVAACCIHSLNAWPWDKKTTTRRPRPTTTTTTTPAPAVMSREKFLAKLTSSSNAIDIEVARSHQLVHEAEQDDKVGQAIAKVDVDVSAYMQQFTDAVNKYAQRVINGTADTSSCLVRYLDDKDEVEAYVLPKAKNSIKEDMQNVRDTATAADALPNTMATLMARGKAEAAKPDGEYGGDVDAILKAVAKVVSKATWNNDHITTVVDDLEFAANVALSLGDAHADMNAALDYADLCVRRIRRSLSHH